MLILKQITKEYKLGDTVVSALRGIDLNFRKTEFAAVLGPAGCGKTTLLNIIGGLDRFSKGDLSIDGKSTKDFTDSEWDSWRSRSVGFVFRAHNLISHRTVLSNVELALTLSGVGKAERRRRAKEALEKVGLGGQLYKKPDCLSLGQMQRAAIARALINDPDILLADEPAGALDAETGAQIMDILKDISKGRLVIMATDNPDLSNTYADRIIRLHDGRVIGDSSPFNEHTIQPVVGSRLPKTKTEDCRKCAMSFYTALTLSLSRLMTKKTRAILTAFAGSIGIIGIALYISLANGIQSYTSKAKENSLSEYPLNISAEATDKSDSRSAGTTEQRKSETDNVNLTDNPVTPVFKALSSLLAIFSSVYLVVSSILTGIVTYISVLERKREIGILRSIGASKRDIARVVSAEALSIGLAAGILGIALTLILIIPINLIIRKLTGITGFDAELPALAGSVLVVISMLLTFIAGLIPTRIAARRNPAEALRTE